MPAAPGTDPRSQAQLQLQPQPQPREQLPGLAVADRGEGGQTRVEARSERRRLLHEPCLELGTGASLDAAQKAGVVLAWGNFVTVLINFILLALVIFWMVKGVNRVRASIATEQPAAPATPPEDVVLLREIRDELRRK